MIWHSCYKMSPRQQLFISDVFAILQSIDQELIELGIQRRINLYSLGGTKLMLEDFKSSSKDLDFIISRKDSVTLGETIQYVKRAKGVTIDLFYDGDISGYIISDYRQTSRKINTSLSKLQLFYLDDLSFVITKAIAGRIRDLEEIYPFLKKREISELSLRKRFSEFELKEDQAEEVTHKFDNFIKSYFHQH